MKKILALSFCSAALVMLSGCKPQSSAPSSVPQGFVSLFNGKDLQGWHGDSRYWSVKDGAITAEVSAAAPLEENTYLVWQGGQPGDFELRLQARFVGKNAVENGANAGVQYRSHYQDGSGFTLGGFQFDLDAAAQYAGMLYEEQGRQAISAPGQSVEVRNGPAPAVPITDDSYVTPEQAIAALRKVSNGSWASQWGAVVEVKGTTASSAELKKVTDAVRAGEWVEIKIVAEGNRLKHYLNNIQTVEVVDRDEIHGLYAGLIGLQLHAGAPMTVQFKDIYLREIIAAPQGEDEEEGEGEPGQIGKATPVESLKLAPGFTAELLYSVPKEQQGSWVSMAFDPKGRLLTVDQYGALYRMTTTDLKVERVKVEGPIKDFGGAHGLLYFGDSLYVMINEPFTVAPGIWRLRDQNNDDVFEEVSFVRSMYGRSEHGVHALVPAPDSKSIYFANGNHSALPRYWEHSRPRAWSEDHLLPRMWDASGHAVDIYAPGGYIGKVDPAGEAVDIVSIGYRNQYDIAFDTNGELFTYDSDMEWDEGSPWYVPTRVVHAVSGGDYGWRSGAGRWPDHYPDSLPPVLDTGAASPTGMVFGTGAKFPAKYQRALYVSDWTYGTLYAVHLSPNGASFTARREEFVAGKPLPLTDVLISPQDGHLYFSMGGRLTQSAVYRVKYIGTESTAAVVAPAPTAAAQLRRQLERLHQGQPAAAAALDEAWPHLNSDDRFIRWAARVAVEHQPVAQWADRALTETRTWAKIEVLLALARMGTSNQQPQLLSALQSINFKTLNPAQQLAIVRVWQLAFIRMGAPDQATAGRVVERLQGLFPSREPLLDRELATLLVYLGAERATGQIVARLRDPEPAQLRLTDPGSKELLSRNVAYGQDFSATLETRPVRQQIAYAYILRNAKVGWTESLKQQYFSWFPTTQRLRGGASFEGFIQNIRADALQTVAADAGERTALTELSASAPAAVVANRKPAVKPEGPGESYTVDSALKKVGELKGRNFARGEGLYSAILCVNCHQMADNGGGIGPVLTQAGNRYSARDLLESIIQPNAVVSPQYAGEQLTLKDGTVYTGLVVRQEGDGLLLQNNPLDASQQITVRLVDIASRQKMTQSLMPMGLINALNGEELQDLLAYILAGGNAADPMFAAK